MSQSKRITVAFLLCTLGACADTDDGASSTSVAATEAPRIASPTSDTSATVRHMHLHAEQLDRLNDALAQGDLEAAGTPAYWLSRHSQLTGIPADWQPLLARMRTEARFVEETTDLSTARAAAVRLADACDDCHRANDVTVRVSER